MALEVVFTIGVALLAEWLFVRATGALQVPVPPKTAPAVAAELWMVNHALTVIAMMLGAIVCMMGGFGTGNFQGPRQQAGFVLFLPLPLLAMLAVGLSVHVRVVSLALLAVVLAAGTYCRRFGLAGFMGGMLAFMGAFLGFFLQAEVSMGDFGWLVAEVMLGVAVLLLVHFTLFWPRPETAFARMQRSYSARARALAEEVAELYEATAGRAETPAANRKAERRLQLHLLRLNEAALLMDAQLSSPGAVPACWSPAALHQLLFDAEVALSNVARFAHALARRPIPEQACTQVVFALRGVRDADLAAVSGSAAAIDKVLEAGTPEITGADHALLHRFATSVTDLATALRSFRLYPESQPPDVEPPEFQPQVPTFGGWLPGSAFIAGTASQERGGSGLIERIRLAPYARTAIQMGIAVAGAIIAGDALSGRRFYWAVIAAFITFMGASTVGEQVRKSVFRVAGTVIGVILGAVLAHLTGRQVDLQIVVVLVSLFLGLYLFRVNYTFMTIGITVMVSQLYVELDEFSNSLLLLRLAETSVGAGVAILTVLLVLPLHIGRVARVAARQQLEALADLISRALERLADPASVAGSDLELRAAARRVDVAYQALVAVAWPMRTPLLGRQAPRISGFLATMAAARHYARNLILDVSTSNVGRDTPSTEALAAAGRQLADSIAAITGTLAVGDSGKGKEIKERDTAATTGTAQDTTVAVRQYVCSASLFARVADALPRQPLRSRPQLALRDLQLLDSALAETARWAEVPVTDLDAVSPMPTTPFAARPGPPGAAAMGDPLGGS